MYDNQILATVEAYLNRALRAERRGNHNYAAALLRQAVKFEAHLSHNDC